MAQWLQYLDSTTLVSLELVVVVVLVIVLVVVVVVAAAAIVDCVGALMRRCLEEYQPQMKNQPSRVNS